VRPPIRTGIYAKIAKIHHSENNRICLLRFGGVLGKLIEKINLNIIKIDRNIYKILIKVPSKIIKYVETTRLVENGADANYTDALALIKKGNCAKAEKLLQMAISKRHAKAIPMLASLLINDRSTLLQMSISKRHTKAVARHALLLFNDRSTNLEKVNVPKYLISLGINFGCLDCYSLDAFLKEEYHDSIEVKLDALKTAQYCANSGSMFGKYVLACIVSKGIPNHLEPDYCLAYRLFIETAEFISHASLNAALQKKDGRGTHIDLNGSFELMLRSATQGNQQAIYWTAVNYYESIGVEKSIKRAIYWCSLIEYDSGDAAVLMRRLKQDEFEASQA
jgi:TPR repeat protein